MAEKTALEQLGIDPSSVGAPNPNQNAKLPEYDPSTMGKITGASTQSQGAPAPVGSLTTDTPPAEEATQSTPTTKPSAGTPPPNLYKTMLGDIDTAQADLLGANQHKQSLANEQARQATMWGTANAYNTAQAAAQQQYELDQLAKDQAESEADAQKRMAEHQAMIRDQLNKKVDPDHFWATRSAPTKILAAISMALGGFGAALTHTNNTAATIINDAINRDVEAQNESIKNGWQAVAADNDLMHNQMAEKHYIAEQKRLGVIGRREVVKDMFNGMAARMNSDDKYYAAQQQIADLDKENAKTGLDMAKDRFNVKRMQRTEAQSVAGQAAANANKIAEHIREDMKFYQDKGATEHDAMVQALHRSGIPENSPVGVAMLSHATGGSIVAAKGLSPRIAAKVADVDADIQALAGYSNLSPTEALALRQRLNSKYGFKGTGLGDVGGTYTHGLKTQLEHLKAGYLKYGTGATEDKTAEETGSTPAED